MKNQTPQGQELDLEYLKELMAKADNPKGPCHKEALRATYKYQKKGIPYKLCRGKYNGEGHYWTEYLENGKWLIDDPVQGVKGWEREKAKMYSSTALETVPDWRKES